MNRLRIAFFGAGKFAAPALYALASEHHVIQAFCPPPRPMGRHLKLTWCPAAAAAQSLQIPVYEKPDSAAYIKTIAPDVIVVCDYGIKITPQILAAAPRGGINIHPSLLPRWRGAAPIARAIWNGDTRAGVTIMQMNEFLDSGDILLQKSIPMPPDATSQTLSDTLSAIGSELLLQTLRDNPPPMPQENIGVTYARKIFADERELNFNNAAAYLERQIRALYPAPGTYARCALGRINIHSARSHSKNNNARAGAILSANKNGVVVACGKGSLTLLILQRRGKKPLAAGDFLRGLKEIPAHFELPNNDINSDNPPQ